MILALMSATRLLLLLRLTWKMPPSLARPRMEMNSVSKPEPSPLLLLLRPDLLLLLRPDLLLLLRPDLPLDQLLLLRPDLPLDQLLLRRPDLLLPQRLDQLLLLLLPRRLRPSELVS